MDEHLKKALAELEDLRDTVEIFLHTDPEDEPVGGWMEYIHRCFSEGLGMTSARLEELINEIKARPDYVAPPEKPFDPTDIPF